MGGSEHNRPTEDPDRVQACIEIAKEIAERRKDKNHNLLDRVLEEIARGNPDLFGFTSRAIGNGKVIEERTKQIKLERAQDASSGYFIIPPEPEQLETTNPPSGDAEQEQPDAITNS